jgi:sugar (pentulose or hexulose) kinase
MPAVLGIDLGTTTITALALDTEQGDILTCHTEPNRAETTAAADKAQGFSEWDMGAMADTARVCLRGVAQRLGDRCGELAGIGLTGQQHGVILVDRRLVPITPFINWQDRRGEQTVAGNDKTYVRQAAERLGEDAPRRTGCKLAAGYLAVTLFWMQQTDALPRAGTACFASDYLGALLTGRAPVTDPTLGASSGVFNILTRDWDLDLLAALDLPRSLFPEVRESGEALGPLTPAMAKATGLATGLPVFVGIGDNQASFLGSVADHRETVLVNVGTGGQVAAVINQCHYDPLLETRPFPQGGYLLVCAGLCGGRSYAVLENFFREVAARFGTARADKALYQTMNLLAAEVPPGANGLRCEPFFTGTRHQPELRASWSGISAENFTPAHMTRALLEGMARAFRTGYEAIGRYLPSPRRRLVGAGNGLRENAVLAEIVARELGLPLAVPLHREEAAFGAALLAAVGAGIVPNLAAAGRLVRHGEAVGRPQENAPVTNPKR